MITSVFFRRLFLPYLLLIGVAIVLVGAFAARLLSDRSLQATRQSLRDQSQWVAHLVGADPMPQRMAQLSEELRGLQHDLDCRITIIAQDGTVLADSEGDAATMENHANRPEIIAAAEHSEGSDVRTSATVHRELLYFARRVELPGGQSYFVRLAVRPQAIEASLRTLYVALGTAMLCAIVGAGLICYYFARRHTAPLLGLDRFAQALAMGDLGRRLPLAGKGELGTLAHSLNAMADSLGSRLGRTVKDNEELRAILASMSEGVIATDTRMHILLVNRAAAQLLGFEQEGVQGKLLWEVVRNEPILRATTQVLDGGPGRSFQVGPFLGRHLEVTICTFPPEGPPAGLVMVAHDATESVRYQELRKEFVANVSHELRTPLTSIRGFAETLRDGAMMDPVKGPEFLAIIERHADQLTNLIADLLELSRLESHPDLPQCVLLDLGSAARRAIELLGPAAQKKGHELTVQVDPQLPPVFGNTGYLERAVANLVENAVKYTPERGRIAVSVTEQGPYVVVEVSDNGIGIPADDIPRIFERFYRVDRSRSRDMGGTGLGLSIVKHVAQAHRGTVEVSSTPGGGSSFKLKIPVSPAAVG